MFTPLNKVSKGKAPVTPRRVSPRRVVKSPNTITAGEATIQIPPSRGPPKKLLDMGTQTEERGKDREELHQAIRDAALKKLSKAV